ncbi:hypothetical protein JYU34_010007 [Plutella xylostella]|uniref:Reverse transcriptase domain-containing protein n=1 Tax=Plutella xylostella TaxID=51655 RepID=A0ABQ7QIR3_PLUXY|nr:hypothetical protein JYU34_010007 [Plutella xylostella]
MAQDKTYNKPKMINTSSKFVSFNCKNVKRSAQCIQSLCVNADLVALQETWLLPHDITYLGTLDYNFGYTGKSAVDTSTGLLRGRPYGGVAILWRKSVFPCVQVITCKSVRISCIQLSMRNHSALVFSVYMPTDEPDNLTEFTECLSEIYAIVEGNNVESVYILGDLNAHPNTLFCREMLQFCSEQNWLCADFEQLGINSDTYTFISEANGSKRWLDHCLVTQSAFRTIVGIKIEYDVLWSDHFPIVFECNLNLINMKVMNNPVCVKISNVRWGNKKDEEIQIYAKSCHEYLSSIVLPSDLTTCCNTICHNVDHRNLLDKMYSKIVKALSEAAVLSSAGKSSSNKKQRVIGWNKHVKDAHATARAKFQQWLLYGKPTSGYYYDEMCLSRKVFKSKLQWCQNNQQQIAMDILASHHKVKDFSRFWKATNKLNTNPSLPVSVDGVTDPKAIADLFRGHFKVQSPIDVTSQGLSADTHTADGPLQTQFTSKEVATIIRFMSRGKSPGQDGLSIEHLKYGGEHVSRVLSLFYNSCLGHSYLPREMMETIVVPITKNRTGDISDRNNYRPISLATIIAKVFDGLLDARLSAHLQLNDAQFGFRPGLSTESAVLGLKHTVKYYTDRKTNVYACFLDLSKAFDLVSYNVLWEKCRKSNLPMELVNIFQYWYDHQSNKVRWGDVYSDEYGLECGVRQGGITSPKLFNLYMDELIGELSSMHAGCYVDGKSCNNFSYADDMVLLSPSTGGLVKLLGACEQYAEKHGLKYNVTKSEIMIFKTENKLPQEIPSFLLCKNQLNRVTRFKYLGHIVTDDLKDDEDIERERRALAVRANMLARRFARCTREVKVTLFRAYCQSFYTCSLWVNYTQRAINSLRVQYNNAFRMLLGLPRHCSASGMFAEARVDGFHAIVRKRTASLLSRVRGSTNNILAVIAGRLDGPILKHWVSVIIGTLTVCGKSSRPIATLP